MEQHLTPQAFARLVDETPNDVERAHLASCESCSDELEAFRDQSAALGQLPDVRPPRGDWAVLEARMASDGLIRVEPGLFGKLARTPGWMRTAAMVVLFVGGVGVGVGIAGTTGIQPVATSPNGTSDARLVSATPAATVDEAVQAVQIAERVYVDALVQLRQMTTDDYSVTSDPEARLASLEYAILALQAGVQGAPADPGLNGLLASAMAEKQATMRQVSSATDWY